MRIVALLAILTATTLRADRVDEYVAAQMKRFDVPGVSFAVLKNGTIIKIASYGLADITRKIPAADDKVYKIGSISKQFIASGIMLLVQDGRMKLDEPVSAYLTLALQAWPQFLEQQVFEPAGMTHTTPTNLILAPPNRAVGYTGRNNQKVAPEWVALRPSGAFYSTLRDMAKWDAALYTERLIAKSRAALLSRAGRPRPACDVCTQSGRPTRTSAADQEVRPTWQPMRAILCWT